MFVSLHYLRDGRLFPVRTAAGRQITLGSGSSCHVRIEAEGVAPAHARLRLTDEGIVLDNLTEPGFTLVNGYPISSYFLARNDRIQMASAELVLDISPDDRTSAMVTCRRCGAAVAPPSATPLCPGCALAEAEKGATRPMDSGRGTAVSLTTRTERLEAISLVAGYDMLGVLGEGVQGRVFKLRDQTTGKLVAAKQLTGTSPKAAKRFAREAAALRRLQHENIVALVDFRDDVPPLLLMELVEGTSLTSLMEKHGRIDPQRALSFVRQAASALACAAEQGIVHRDIKPANILITREDRVKLTDFGLVRLESETTKLTMTGNWVGTPYYMSPDQLNGAEIDSRTDVWGLGVTFYHAITGTLPFDAPNLSVLFKRILTEPVDFAPLRALVGRKVVMLFERMLEKEPALRPWPGAVSEELQRALES